MCKKMPKITYRHVTMLLWSMSQFGGLWKQQNSPACTESVCLHNVEVGHYRKKEDQCDPLFRWPVTVQWFMTQLPYVLRIHSDPVQWWLRQLVYIILNRIHSSDQFGDFFSFSWKFILSFWSIDQFQLFFDYDSFLFFIFSCEQFMWFLDYDTAHLYLLLCFAFFFFCFFLKSALTICDFFFF